MKINEPHFTNNIQQIGNLKLNLDMHEIKNKKISIT